MFNKLVMSSLKSVLRYHNSNFVIEIGNCFSAAVGFWPAPAQPSPKNWFQLVISCVWWEGVVPLLPVPVCWGWLHKVFPLILLFYQDVAILPLKKCSAYWIKWSMSEIVLYRRKNIVVWLTAMTVMQVFSEQWYCLQDVKIHETNPLWPQ